LTTRRSTFFGPEMLPQVNEIITALELTSRSRWWYLTVPLKVFFLIHLDFLAQLDDLAHLPPGPTGLHPWPEMLVRLSRASRRIDCVDSRAGDWYGK